MAKETVGDMIVRERKDELANPSTTKARRAELLAKPAPRSMVHETWPPTTK